MEGDLNINKVLNHREHMPHFKLNYMSQTSVKLTLSQQNYIDSLQKSIKFNNLLRQPNLGSHITIVTSQYRWVLPSLAPTLNWPLQVILGCIITAECKQNSQQTYIVFHTQNFYTQKNQFNHYFHAPTLYKTIFLLISKQTVQLRYHNCDTTYLSG